MPQSTAITDFVLNFAEDFASLAKTGDVASTHKLLHNLHYWLLIGIEERVLNGQIDSDYDAIGVSQVTALRLCADFGSRLCDERTSASPVAALDSLQAAAENIETESENGYATAAVLHALRFTAAVFDSERDAALVGYELASEERAVTAIRVALSRSLMRSVFSRLGSIAWADYGAGGGMTADVVATVLAITDSSIGMLCAIRNASFSDVAGATEFRQELEDYIASDRLDAGGREAVATMENALANVLQVWRDMPSPA